MGNRAFVPHTISSDSALGGSVIDHSIRFNRGDNPHFSRTPSSASNRKVWTYSVWLKRTDFGARSFLQAYDGSSSRRFQLSFNGSDQINFNQGGNSSSGVANSYMKFRDPTAWYHIVVAVNYNEDSSANRIRIYVNGSEISLNITDSIENADGLCNSNVEHEIGAIGSSSNVFDGYMADINFVDGAMLDPSYFGYTEFQTKVWRPKRFNPDLIPNRIGRTFSNNWTASANGFGSHPVSYIFDNDYSNFMNNAAGGQIITWNTTSYNLSGRLKIYGRSSSGVYDIYVNGNTTKVADTPSSNGMIDCGTFDDIREIQFAGTSYNTNTGLGSAGIYVYMIFVDGVLLRDTTQPYGPNGFKLDFRDFSGDTATTIGRDYSGNGNNFSPDNFGGTGDGAIDSPTNNFTSFNKIMDYSLNANISEAGLRVEGPDTGHSDRRIFAPFAIPLTGKYYVEVKCVKNGARGTIGFSDGDINGGGSGNNWFSFGFHGGGYSTSFTKVGSNTSDFSLNDYVSFALDMDAGKMWLVKNGNVDVTAQESITAIVRTNLDRPLRWFYQETSSDESAALFNFGQFPYNYTVPDGFKTLSSRNIQPTYYDATNQPVKTFLNPKKHFNCILYTPNSGNLSVTGVGFKPDLLWLKSATQGYRHYMFDSIRGTGAKAISSNLDAVEGNDSGGALGSFDSDGFSVGGSTGFNDNGSGTNGCVAWCWKAGDSTSSNTAGDVTSTVSVNDEAGFSIVSFTTPAGSGFSIGHGLSKAPETIWMKNRDHANNWDIYHHENGSNPEQYRLIFNSTSARQDYPYLDDTVPSSTVFRTRGGGNWYNTGNKIIAYCFYSVPGFSKYGSYVGNGSSNGVYVHLGFKPAMMIIKRISNTEDWWIHDNQRNPYNPIDKNLYPNGDNTTATEEASDFYADGFKLRTSNQNWNNNNETYVYWAWADQPGTTTYGSSPTAR